MRAGSALGKQPLSFNKEEAVNCDNSSTSFVNRAEEEKTRAIQEAISVLMKQHGD